MLFAATFERAFATAIEEGTAAAMPKQSDRAQGGAEPEVRTPLTETFLLAAHGASHAILLTLPLSATLPSGVGRVLAIDSGSGAGYPCP